MRLTQRDAQGKAWTDEGEILPGGGKYGGAAIEKLAIFEDFVEELVASQQTIPEEMARLKKDGKEKTVTFKELMVKKMTNTTILSRLRFFGLYEA
jgi:hypothetical protein